MSNLMQETTMVLEDNKKLWEDVIWIGDKEKSISIEIFKKVADNYYYSGFGSNEVNLDLLIVGKDFWLERWEYDGSEGWAYREEAKQPDKTVSYEDAYNYIFQK